MAQGKIRVIWPVHFVRDRLKRRFPLTLEGHNSRAILQILDNARAYRANSNDDYALVKFASPESSTAKGTQRPLHKLRASISSGVIRNSTMRMVSSPAIYRYVPSIPESSAQFKGNGQPDFSIRCVDQIYPSTSTEAQYERAENHIVCFEAIRGSSILGRMRCSVETDLQGFHHGFIDEMLMDTGESSDVGPRLLQAAVKWLKERRVSSIFAFIDFGDVDTLKSLKSVGFHRLSHRVVFAV